MKKALLSLVCLWVIGFGEVKAQWVTIPDANFVTWLNTNGFSQCMNGNQMDTTCAAVINTRGLYFSQTNVRNFTGVQYFRNLDTLDCYYNTITSLPALPPALKVIDITNCNLQSLPALPTTLRRLMCGHNSLDSLPALNDSLSRLDCVYNYLTSLPTLPNSLRNLACGRNRITQLPALPDSLRALSCNHNLLTALPTLPSSLYSLSCYSNQITALPPLPNTVYEILAMWNSLTTLPLLPNSLGWLVCYHNQLTSLPNLPDSLKVLSLDNNPQLECLPPFRGIFAVGGPNNSFTIQGTGIKCLPNYFRHGSYQPALDTMPICDLFNTNGCEVGWKIYGSIYQDENNDCVRQNSEPKVFPAKMNLYESGSLVQSGYFFTGSYSFDTQFSNYEVALDTAGFGFDLSCPSSGDTLITVSAQDSLRYGIDFGIKCKAGFDVAAWSIGGGRLRPLTNERVNITCGDIANIHGGRCISGIGGSVIVTITGPASYISPAPGGLTPNTVNGNTITWSIADFASVNSYSDFNIIIQVNNSAQLNDYVCFTLVVATTQTDDNPANNVLNHCSIVGFAIDPNYKEVYPSSDIAATQGWLTFTIHFQNTGNDTAIHVQIIDTLDSDIDMASFKLLAYSHPNITQILEGGIVKFNFPNIMLPDSHVNEPLSHGYIQYKVKLKDNLPIGTQIKNTAYIYFDFNAPVVTNTTLNTITTATAVSPLSVGEGLGVRIFPNPAKDKVQILIEGAKENVTMNLYSPIGELVQSLKIKSPHELDLSGLSSGVYYLSVTTTDGLFSSQRLMIAR